MDIIKAEEQSSLNTGDPAKLVHFSAGKTGVPTLEEVKLGLHNAQGRLARMAMNPAIDHTDLVALQDSILAGINYVEHLQGTFKEIVDILRYQTTDVI